MERERLRGDEDASRTRPVQQSAGQKERAGSVGDNPDREEPQHHDLHREPDEQRPTPAEPIGKHANDRARHHAHRAVGREDHADERKREAKAQPHDGQDGKRDLPFRSGGRPRFIARQNVSTRLDA